MVTLLEQFAAFARCGTLLKASEELHITQPTLSRSMKKLEEELGVSLFHRENSKLSLNQTGRIAAEYAQKALSANLCFVKDTWKSRYIYPFPTITRLPVKAAFLSVISQEYGF